ncbi:MAG: GTPase ObgE [Deltaproteobacteria bacterium]|nr:GTPase ObgE [Deltaproteobacteria bacterium]
MKSFPDEVEITVQGGAGGAGCVSFQRAAFKPRGRPDGGDGGSGGEVVLEASQTLRTLSHFRRRRLFQAPNGKPGQSADRHGRSGPPLIISVPLGTRVYDRDTGELLGDLLNPGERLVLAHGGRGGKGNAHFTSSRMRSPRFAQPGEPGGERRVRLELHILADVGLIGQPNAGKSTLLRALTASKARVGAFPFTTLSPQLGVLFQEDEEPLILAEVPGLIPGAHRGKGLGHRFLRHLKRTRLLVHVIDLSQVNPGDPLAPLKELEAEMTAFDSNLLDKPRVIALNKIDLLAPDFPRQQVLKAYEDTGRRVLAVSAQTGLDLDALRQAIWEELRRCGHDLDSAAIPE